ncbi:MAG TPA: H-NS histone family protein [Hyphomicrobiaceae bacterium]|nr:H-NS histone family protein [Hyphomicrobiaceae bacterium]
MSQPQDTELDRQRIIGPAYLVRDFGCNDLSTDAFDIAQSQNTPQRREQMAKLNGIEKMSYAELSQLRAQIDRLMVDKQNSERVALRQKLSDMAKEHGLSLEEVLGKGRKGKGSVAPKYRDPKNPDNTWTGRGRMPRWMVAATKGGKSSKDDYLI